jgi:type II secretory pathway predicted ATPase ExeA
MSEQHSTAYTMLEYSVQDESGGFAVITGEIGSGKTTIINSLIKSIKNKYTIAKITNSQKYIRDLLPWVMAEYGLKTDGYTIESNYNRFKQYVNDSYDKGKPCLLVIDEAQNYQIATLEGLRTLTNINDCDTQKIKLILSGQSELLDKLSGPKLRQFQQRVLIQYHLKPLSKDESLEYINYRINEAGGRNDIFTYDASVLIWYYSRGIPRVINTLCEMSLVYGYAEQKKQIDTGLIRTIIKDRASGGLFRERENQSSNCNVDQISTLIHAEKLT